MTYSLGGNVNTQAGDDASALFEASKNGHAEVVEILLSKRADVNKANKTGLLPIHVAAKNGHDRLVGLLHYITVNFKFIVIYCIIYILYTALWNI